MLMCCPTSLYCTWSSIFIMKIFIVLLTLFLFSCTQKSDEPIDISKTNNLAISPQWAVITEPYASYLAQADDSSEISAYGRVGDIIEVTGSTIGDNNVLWYNFESGWLSQSSIQIYANKLQADFAANALIK